MTHRSVFPTLPFQTKWVRILLRAARYTIRPSTRVRVPLSSTPPSVQHMSSTQGPHLFSHLNPWVQHQKTPKFNTKNPAVNTENPSVQHIPEFNTNNPSVQHSFLGLNWGFFGVELRDFGGCKRVALLCWTKGVPIRPYIFSYSYFEGHPDRDEKFTKTSCFYITLKQHFWPILIIYFNWLIRNL